MSIFQILLISRPWYERVLQFALRFTWEAPHTLAGNLTSHGRNTLGQVDDVSYWGGVILVNQDKPQENDAWGFTFGPYISSKNVISNP